MNRKLLIVLALAVLTSCSNGGRPSTDAVSQKPSPSPSPKPIICPLTGREASKGIDADRPALAVKIENSTAARPQAGLDSADIVYEELAEGGITRFMAVFQCSDASALGPIRSARLVDVDILLEYAPVLFAFSGANSIVRTKVDSTVGITDIRFGKHGAAYHRERGRPAPHDLFSSSEKLRALSSLRGAPSSGLRFDPNASAIPTPTPARNSASPSVSATVTTPPGRQVTFDYSSSANATSYTYDPTVKAYLRFQGKVAHKLVTGRQVSAVNVIIMQVRVRQGTIRDSIGNYSPDITVVGEGKVVVLRGGVATEGRWVRESLSRRTRFVDSQGKPINLLPGNTWINLVPTDRQVTVT
ncbi:MAG TPA: DUF3048 domain-containing protein [Actinomycetota bacterium]|nr:DUF3048 domain-containing protein [Actinomycetota bacterium]